MSLHNCVLGISLAVRFPTVIACGMFTQYEKEDCAMLTGKDALRCVDYRQRKAHAEMSREVAEMLKVYRQCVGKHEGDGEKARENCEMYRDVLQSIQVSSMSCS